MKTDIGVVHASGKKTFLSHSMTENTENENLTAIESAVTHQYHEHTPLSWSQSGEDAPLHWLRGPKRGDTWPEPQTESAS